MAEGKAQWPYRCSHRVCHPVPPGALTVSLPAAGRAALRIPGYSTRIKQVSHPLRSPATREAVRRKVQWGEGPELPAGPAEHQGLWSLGLLEGAVKMSKLSTIAHREALSGRPEASCVGEVDKAG